MQRVAAVCILAAPLVLLSLSTVGGVTNLCADKDLLQRHSLGLVFVRVGSSGGGGAGWLLLPGDMQGRDNDICIAEWIFWQRHYVEVNLPAVGE